MGSSAPSKSSAAASAAAATAEEMNKKAPGFLANAMKHKHSFIQFFAMTGIFLLSMRSLGQKYKINALEEDTTALKEEQSGLNDRVRKIKEDLLHEASQEPTGLFASRLKVLFGEEH